MLVDLVQTATRDGLRLDGAYQAPAGAGPAAVPVDAFCLIHGTGGNFYSSTLFDGLAERLLALGCGVLRANTRGHDGISTAAITPLTLPSPPGGEGGVRLTLPSPPGGEGRVRGGGRRQGAAYEIVDDCRHDVAAWVSWLAQRAGPRVGLLGHSLGAVKCLYALAREPHPAVQCLVAVSPPRLSYSWFCASPQAQDFLATYALAEQHVERGEPAALLDVKLPLPFAIAAAGYVEKYGPDERYNYLKFAAGVPCPALVTHGSLEVESNMAFHGAPEALAGLKAKCAHFSAETIAGADHFYTGVREELVARVEGWLRSTLL